MCAKKTSFGLEVVSSADEKRFGYLEGLNGDSKSAYDIIRERIFEAIDSQDKRWVQSWAVAKSVRPINYKTKHKYSGLNSFFLGLDLYFSGETNPFFLTYNQASELGGQVVKGATGIPIFYWSDNGKGKQKVKVNKKSGKRISLDPTDDESQIEEVEQEFSYAFLKYYTVFHAKDIEGIEWEGLDEIQPIKLRDTEKIETAESIIESMPSRPPLVHKDPNRAYYSPGLDIVNMPKMAQFSLDQEYYATYFHELIHATGHPNRLDRPMGGRFGDKKYAFEELIAEIGASFLCGESGILNFTFENSTAYLKGWKNALKKNMEEDKNFMVRAARRAEEAANFILGKVKEEKTYTPKPKMQSAKVSHNEEKKGIEVKLEVKPDEEYIKTLKELGFKWSVKQKMWYAPYTAQKYTKVNSLLSEGEMVLSGVSTDIGADCVSAFIAMHSKVTPMPRILSLVNKIKGAIKRGAIRKGTPMAKCIMEVQTKLVKAYNIGIEKNIDSLSLNINTKDRNKYLKTINALGKVDAEAPSFNVKSYKVFLPYEGNGFKIKVYKGDKYLSLISYGAQKYYDTVVKTKEMGDEIGKEALKKYLTGGMGGLNGFDAPNTQGEGAKAPKCFNSESESLHRLSSVQEGEDEFDFTRADERNKVKAPDGFTLPGEMGKLLQNLQPFKLSIVITGDPHAGKTEFSSQLIDSFADKFNKVAWFSLEQGGLESKDTRGAIDRNIKPSNQSKIMVTGTAKNGLDTIKKAAAQFDVLFIDSWQKLGEPSTKFDTLRIEFPNTIFIAIFQQNGEGGTRGGVATDYDTPILLKVHKVDKTFVNNYVEVKKNRGNNINVHYLISKKKTILGSQPETEEKQ